MKRLDPKHHYKDMKWVTLARSSADKFWPKVQKGSLFECWLWQGYIDKHGYGEHSVNRNPDGTRPKYPMSMKAHRVSYLLSHGGIDHSLLVCHTCHNRACVNPEHLYQGTYRDNYRDAEREDRHSHGSAHGNAKLTESDVVELRRLHAMGGWTYQQLADQFGLASKNSIGSIVHRHTWKHVT